MPLRRIREPCEPLATPHWCSLLKAVYHATRRHGVLFNSAKLLPRSPPGPRPPAAGPRTATPCRSHPPREFRRHALSRSLTRNSTRALIPSPDSDRARDKNGRRYAAGDFPEFLLQSPLLLAARRFPLSRRPPAPNLRPAYISAR